MEYRTETLTVTALVLYHMTYDGTNTGYTLDEVNQLIEEHGPGHELEVTVQIPVEQEPVDVVAETVEESTLEESQEEG